MHLLPQEDDQDDVARAMEASRELNGRRRDPGRERLNAAVSVRFTDSEFAELEKTAGAHKMTVSRYARIATLKALKEYRAGGSLKDRGPGAWSYP